MPSRYQTTRRPDLFQSNNNQPQKNMKEIKIHEVGGVLDTSTSGKEQKDILDLLESHPHIGLDLSRCTYVSNAGLRVMLYACKVASGKGGRVNLISVSVYRNTDWKTLCEASEAQV